MRKLYTTTLLFFAAIWAVHANVIDDIHQVYKEDFNQLADSGGGFLDYQNELNNWYLNADRYKVSNGQDNQGAFYSFGENEAADRALGAIVSGAFSQAVMGTSFKNNTGTSIGQLQISYTGEQWRRSNKKDLESQEPIADTLFFEYSTHAQSFDDEEAEWIAVEDLFFLSPYIVDENKALDGNLAEYQSKLTASIDVDLPMNQVILIRWTYTRKTDGIVGSRDGLAIDDLEVQFSEGTEITCEFNEEDQSDITSFERNHTHISLEYSAVDGASGYLIILDAIQDENFEFGEAEDGIFYEAGDKINDSDVLGVVTNTNFEAIVPEAEQYYINVVPFYECESSIFYGAVTFREFFIDATCDVAHLLETNILSLETTETSISFELQEVNDAIGYIILLDKGAEIDSAGNQYDWGYLDDGESYEAGDLVGQSIVAYVGETPNGTLDGLEEGSEYNISAFPIFECDNELVYGAFTSERVTTKEYVTSVREKINTNMSLYPNPLIGNTLHIQSSDFKVGQAKIQIYSIIGAEVYHGVHTLNTHTSIHLPNHLASGRYTLRIKQDDQHHIGSFIVVE